MASNSYYSGGRSVTEVPQYNVDRSPLDFARALLQREADYLSKGPQQPKYAAQPYQSARALAQRPDYGPQFQQPAYTPGGHAQYAPQDTRNQALFNLVMDGPRYQYQPTGYGHYLTPDPINAAQRNAAMAMLGIGTSEGARPSTPGYSAQEEIQREQMLRDRWQSMDDYNNPNAAMERALMNAFLMRR